MSETIPVLIRGVGPAGLTLALELARFGVPFRIAGEASPAAGSAEPLGVEARTLELLEATQITDRLLAVAQRIGLGRLPTPYPFLALIPPAEIERVMRETLSAFAVTVEHDPGAAAQAARFVAFCDGERRAGRLREGNAFRLDGREINRGIGDAVNLAWKLALVIRDGVPLELLDTYAEERGTVRPRAAHLRVAYPRSRLSVNGSPARGGLRAGMRVRGARPAGHRPQTIVVHPHERRAAITLVLRPDGYAGYVSEGAHALGAVTYVRNVIGLRA